VVLDPYRTSFRNSGRATPWLIAIEAGNQPATGDPGQNISDLRGAGLVGAAGSPPPLSALGQRVLDDWRKHSVADSDDRHEIARAALLVRAGIELGVALYTDALAFWRELVEFRAAKEWFQDVPGLYLASYLNASDAAGFNPYRVLRALDHQFDTGLDPWNAWALAVDAPTGLDKFMSAVTQSAARPGGRRAFCQAMEAVRLVQQNVQDLPDEIATWGVPT
jgi:hypothetical protein